MAYSELIKNFDHIREYMREFFVYGFKSRDEFADKKSLRSYDNEKRRIENYLGDYVSFKTDKSGKRVFISMESRAVTHNPLYRAFKAKSFTNRDITLHFILMDLLADGAGKTVQEIADCVEEDYLAEFENTMCFDESTLRKKLQEYTGLGLVRAEKQGRQMRYFLNRDDLRLEDCRDAIRFFTEENPLGVIGSFLEDKMEPSADIYTFKNHYRMNAYDADIMELLLQAIHEKRRIRIVNIGRNSIEHDWQLIPLKIYISTAGGRNYLIAQGTHGKLLSFRIDYVKKVTLEEVDDSFDTVMAQYMEKRPYMWGVNAIGEQKTEQNTEQKTEHVEMDIYVGPKEQHIVTRLNREKRCGTVLQLDKTTYRYSADVYDANEMLPWIRTYIGRIVRFDTSNSHLRDRWNADLEAMYANYQ